MSHETITRPAWDIDRTLAGLVGQHVRVSARSCCPRLSGPNPGIGFILVSDLVLPDSSQPGSAPVYFEGRLSRFERQIGVVHVWLKAPVTFSGSPDGLFPFRGATAAILRGPAIVELAFPFRVERLPPDPHNYWLDLRLSCAQLDLPLPNAGLEEPAGP